MKPTGLILKCNRCCSLLEKPGALLFSPPESLIDNGVLTDHCHKYHLCCDCYNDIILEIINFTPEKS